MLFNYFSHSKHTLSLALPRDNNETSYECSSAEVNLERRPFSVEIVQRNASV